METYYEELKVKMRYKGKVRDTHIKNNILIKFPGGEFQIKEDTENYVIFAYRIIARVAVNCELISDDSKPNRKFLNGILSQLWLLEDTISLSKDDKDCDFLVKTYECAYDIYNKLRLV